ncbi:MAG: hypothetical protein Q9172_004125, partial [Xanthocarpia lactea]
KGGAAKGELVLAIYELANSYRHGWGVEKDIVAARTFYECAANMGDTDAMNEVARLYDEGKGGKKDRVSTFFFCGKRGRVSSGVVLLAKVPPTQTLPSKPNSTLPLSLHFPFPNPKETNSAIIPPTDNTSTL